ncbi:hypothetical protein GCM10022220_51820 [Actinocatenispora rupis]|uniref:Uncharacterized protein n=1 Tax=Actinocatenispora rupis TaxID=519421 RepID=A0A8J3NC00_9ACTN|nr:hypothetical protein Aru02nite_44700 [Actinocatenispora rupis]
MVRRVPRTHPVRASPPDPVAPGRCQAALANRPRGGPDPRSRPRANPLPPGRLRPDLALRNRFRVNLLHRAGRPRGNLPSSPELGARNRCRVSTPPANRSRVNLARVNSKCPPRPDLALRSRPRANLVRGNRPRQPPPDLARPRGNLVPGSRSSPPRQDLAPHNGSRGDPSRGSRSRADRRPLGRPWLSQAPENRSRGRLLPFSLERYRRAPVGLDPAPRNRSRPHLAGRTQGSLRSVKRPQGSPSPPSRVPGNQVPDRPRTPGRRRVAWRRGPGVRQARTPPSAARR